MDRDDPAALADELLQRRAAVADQPFGGGVLGIGRAAQEDDGAEALEAVSRKNDRILGGDRVEPALPGDGGDGVDSSRDRLVPVPGSAGVDEYGAAAWLCGSRGRNEEEGDQQQPAHRGSVEKKRAARKLRTALA